MKVNPASREDSEFYRAVYLRVEGARRCIDKVLQCTGEHVFALALRDNWFVLQMGADLTCSGSIPSRRFAVWPSTEIPSSGCRLRSRCSQRLREWTPDSRSVRDSSAQHYRRGHSQHTPSNAARSPLRPMPFRRICSLVFGHVSRYTPREFCRCSRHPLGSPSILDRGANEVEKSGECGLLVLAANLDYLLGAFVAVGALNPCALSSTPPLDEQAPAKVGHPLV